jgi:hypothetical protein
MLAPPVLCKTRSLAKVGGFGPDIELSSQFADDIWLKFPTMWGFNCVQALAYHWGWLCWPAITFHAD